MIIDLPKYAHDVLKFNIASTGILTSLPYLSLWFSSFLFAFVCDYCIKKGYHSMKMGRIIHTSIGKLLKMLFSCNSFQVEIKQKVPSDVLGCIIAIRV